MDDVRNIKYTPSSFKVKLENDDFPITISIPLGVHVRFQIGWLTSHFKLSDQA